jgi:hypothetical protein
MRARAGAAAHLRGLREARGLAEVVGAEHLRAALALAGDQLRRVNLREALLVQRVVSG